MIGKLSTQAQEALERYESMNIAALLPCSLAEDQCGQAGGQSDGQGALLAAVAQEEAVAGVVSLISGEY